MFLPEQRRTLGGRADQEARRGILDPLRPQGPLRLRTDHRLGYEPELDAERPEADHDAAEVPFQEDLEPATWPPC